MIIIYDMIVVYKFWVKKLKEWENEEEKNK